MSEEGWGVLSQVQPLAGDHLSKREAALTLRIIISWGQYAELFNYDDKQRRFVK